MDSQDQKYVTVAWHVSLSDGTEAVVAIDVDMTAKKFREVMGDLAPEDYERWFLATADH